MDLLSPFFCYSFYTAIREDLRGDGRDGVTDENRRYRALRYGPDWRLVLAPHAAIAILVLAGTF